jgi:hypothetical protein
MRNEFYVTTVEIDHPEREHTYRLGQGESLPEGQALKSQKPAGTVKLSEVATIR